MSRLKLSKTTGGKAAIFLLAVFTIVLVYTLRLHNKVSTCYIPDEITLMTLHKTMGLGPVLIDTLKDLDLGAEMNKVREEFIRVRGQLLRDMNRKGETEKKIYLTPERITLIKKYYEWGSLLVSLPISQKKDQQGKLFLEEIKKQWNFYSKDINQGLKTSCP